jgi:hypothetical protein
MDDTGGARWSAEELVTPAEHNCSTPVGSDTVVVATRSLSHCRLQ